MIRDCDFLPARDLAAEIIKRFEGLRLAPYFCPAGLLTCGYGHVLAVNERGIAGCDEAQAARWLAVDLEWALREVQAMVAAVNVGQAAALASLIFNIGAGAFRASTLRRQIEAGKVEWAGAQFERWIFAAGEPCDGLRRRRAFERSIFEGINHGMAKKTGG